MRNNMTKKDREVKPNAYVTELLDLGDGVGLRLLTDLITNETRLIIILDDKTNKTQVYRKWDLIDDLRQGLLRLTGSKLAGANLQSVVYELHIMQHGGWGYGELAKYLNIHILAQLLRAADEHEREGGKPELYYLPTAFYLQEFWNMKMKEYKEVAGYFYNEVIKGKLPWTLSEAVIDWRTVRDKIRNFRVREENGLIHLPPFHSEQETFKFERISLYRSGHYAKAIQFHKSSNPDDAKKHTRVIEKIMKDVESLSENPDNTFIEQFL